MYLQIYKDRNQAHDAIYGKNSENRQKAYLAIMQKDKALMRQERWDKAHVCKHCYMVLPKSGVCDCHK